MKSIDWHSVAEEYQNGEGGPSLANKYDVSSSTIYRHLKRLNVPRRSASKARRQYDVNEKFFGSLESEKPCYWLGFLLADGNAQDGLVRIRLSRKDEGHLHDLKNDLDSEHNIKRTTVGRKGHGVSSLVIGSDRLERRLSSLGVSAQAKDKHLPEVGTGCVRHVVRGFFDGDGHVSVTKKPDRNHYALNFTSASKSLLQDVKHVIRDIGIDTSFTEYDTYWSLRMYGKEKINDFGRWLYKDASRYLSRKKDVFDKL
jgi:hypothetical protein